MGIDLIINKILSDQIYTNNAMIVSFMNNLSHSDQLAVISAMYIGRDHIHSDKLMNENISRNDHDHIEPSHFCSILSEKSQALPMYFNAFIRCAIGSNFNFDNF